MEENIIYGIVYTEIDDVKGPNPIIWFPEEMPEEIKMKIGIKTITLVTDEKGILPESLVFIPFPSLKLKGILKYIEFPDDTHRGGVNQSAITLIFKEFNDIVFYKYIKNLESLFSDTAQKIIELGKKKSSNKEIAQEIENLQSKVYAILEDLRIKECSEPQSEPFPQEHPIPYPMREYVAKIIVCGDPDVGKTSIVLRYTNNAFKRTYLPSIGVNICEKTTFTKILSGEDYSSKFVLFDIAGQQKFYMMRKHFYAGADAVLLVFDLTKHDTFESIREWYQDIKKYLPTVENLPTFMIGNKKDLSDQKAITKKEIDTLKKELNLEYIETSAKTGENVLLIFQKIAEFFMDLQNE
jgi:small GTP-binding protein